MSQRTELDLLLLQLRLPGIRRKLREETVTEEMHAILYGLFMVEVEEREWRSEHLWNRGLYGWLQGLVYQRSSLINQLKEFRSERTLRSFELKFQKYDLVILDELGYISFNKEGAELLFSHLSLDCPLSSQRTFHSIAGTKSFMVRYYNGSLNRSVNPLGLFIEYSG